MTDRGYLSHVQVAAKLNPGRTTTSFFSPPRLALSQSSLGPINLERFKILALEPETKRLLVRRNKPHLRPLPLGEQNGTETGAETPLAKVLLSPRTTRAEGCSIEWRIIEDIIRPLKCSRNVRGGEKRPDKGVSKTNTRLLERLAKRKGKITQRASFSPEPNKQSHIRLIEVDLCSFPTS